MNKFWETFKIVLTGVFAVAILAGSFVVFYDIKRQNEPQEKNLDNEALKKEVDALNGEIQKLSDELKNTKSTTKTTVIQKTEKVAGASDDKTTSVESSGKMNINSASASELDKLPGIGETYAQRIIEYREGHGGFKSIEEIKNVKGIGDATFEKMKDLIEI